MRPVRWFSGIDATFPTESGCVVTSHIIHCNSTEGPISYELIQGSTDFDVLDKQEVTVTRVVGQVNVRWSQFVNPELPNLSIPVVRLAVMTVEGPIDVSTWGPPDLFDPASVEESGFMWTRQVWLERNLSWGPVLFTTPDGQMMYANGHEHIDIDIGVNRKIGRDGHVMLIVQKHYDQEPAPPPSPVEASYATFVHYLRVLVKT